VSCSSVVEDQVCGSYIMHYMSPNSTLLFTFGLPVFAVVISRVPP
jgi:hypothetical protein